MTRPTRRDIENRINRVGDQEAAETVSLSPDTTRRLWAIIRDAADAPIHVDQDVREELETLITPPHSTDPDPEISAKAAHAFRVAQIGRGNA